MPQRCCEVTLIDAQATQLTLAIADAANNDRHMSAFTTKSLKQGLPNNTKTSSSEGEKDLIRTPLPEKLSNNVPKHDQDSTTTNSTNQGERIMKS